MSLVTVVTVMNAWMPFVNGDVSELKNVKGLSVSLKNRKQSGAYTAENSNSFSILTKEFLNQPDDGAGGGVANRNGATNNNNNNNNNNAGKQTNRNLSPYPVIRINGVDVNNLPENDDSDEQQQGYVYDKPKIPFEAEEGGATNIQSTTVAPQRDDEPYDGSQGYFYPKPSIPFPLPSPGNSNSPDSDVETIPGGGGISARSTVRISG